MPIRPEQMRRYPGGSIRSRQWRAIRARILERAGGLCERCGAPDRVTIERAADGSWSPARPCDGVRIVLTFAHLDHDPTRNDAANLAALCQRCHNRHDAPHRARNAAVTRRRARASADLFEAGQ